MSSSTNIIAEMESAEQHLHQIGGPILILIGTVSCIINLIVFSKKTQRKNPCSIYFIAYNCSNFVYIYSTILPSILNIGYSIDATSYNLVICRLHLYISILFNCLSPFYLILASIDRILITSPNALTRQRSTRRLAYTCIISVTLFWVLFHVHTLILTNIIQLAPNYFVCYFQGVYLSFISYYFLIEEIIALSLMIIFGLWSIKNIRSIRRVRVAPDLSVNTPAVGVGLLATSSKDRQLIFIVLMDTTIYALFSFVYVIFLLYGQITQNYTKNADRIQIENIVRNLCTFSVGIPFCISSYANLIVSKTFRNELKKVFLRG